MLYTDSVTTHTALIQATSSVSQEHTPAPKENDIRLAYGAYADEGRAEMFRDGEWGTICDNAFAPAGWPSLFCKQLGWVQAETAIKMSRRRAPLPVTGKISFQSPACTAKTADSLSECGTDTNNIDCGHDSDVYIKCTNR